jgi:hypothetical protein
MQKHYSANWGAMLLCTVANGGVGKTQRFRAASFSSLSSRAKRGMCFSAGQNEKRNSSESTIKMIRWSTQA